MLRNPRMYLPGLPAQVVRRGNTARPVSSPRTIIGTTPSA